MFNNVALDVFIGLVFIFLLYSLLATIIQEFIAIKLAFRAKILEKAILRMLEDGKTTTGFQYGDRIQGMMHLLGLKNILKDKTIAPWFYAHPLVKYLAEDNYYSKPAYLEAKNFSKVMIDLLKGFGFPESQAVQSIHSSIMEGSIYKLPINIRQVAPDDPKPDVSNPAIKVLRSQNESVISNDLLQYEKVFFNRNTALYLKSLWLDSGADVNLFRQKLENWFNDTMERATGWYKRYTQLLLFFIGLIIAFTFNVDVLAIHRILSKDKNAREQLVQMAIRSQDQLSPIVEQQRKGEPVNDSILRSTYNLVAKDASEANSILGLGRVWTDTCSMCEDSAHDKSFKERFVVLETDANRIHNTIDSLNRDRKSLDGINTNAITSPTGTNVSLRVIPESTKIRIAVDSTQAFQFAQSPTLKEYERMKAFNDRCLFIQKARKNKWFVYAPNQAGNWETLLGWVITALAVTLGAPFWFDLLSKLIKIRSTGKRIDSSTTDSGDNASTTSSTSTTPVSVNINTNPGEEAVG